jgi:hypothetical protein
LNTRSSFFAALRPAWRGLRANVVPAFVLQCFALGLVIAYFHLPAFGRALRELGELKVRGGYVFSSISTALFGGLIPFLVLLGTGRVEKARAKGELLFYLAFWFWKGAEVDALYRAQSWLFGSSPNALVVGAKTALDQFVYNPLWAAPTQTLCFLWKDAGFSLPAMRDRLRLQALPLRVGTVLVSTWVVWIPTVAIVYSLPLPLQVPLFNLVLCFWCLLLSFLSRE